MREEKRDWYTTEVAASASKYFIDPNTNKVNVKGLIVSGSANLKNDMVKKLDTRVYRSIVHMYDVQYSGEAGFYQTLTLCEDALVNCRYTTERALLARFFDAMRSNDSLYSVSPSDTLYALAAGAVQTLIVWSELAVIRYELYEPSRDTRQTVFSLPSGFGEDADVKWEIKSQMPLLDWILDHYTEFGSDVEVVSGNSALGTQFVQAFGGVGAILRYPVDFPFLAEELGAEEEYEYEY